MQFADAPAVQNHSVARLEVGVAAFCNGTREIDAGNMGVGANQLAQTLEDQAILVVQRGVVDLHQDVALGQTCQFQVFEADLDLAAVGFVKHQRLEHSGLLWTGKVRGKITFERGLACFRNPFLQHQLQRDADWVGAP